MLWSQKWDHWDQRRAAFLYKVNLRVKIKKVDQINLTSLS